MGKIQGTKNVAIIYRTQEDGVERTPDFTTDLDDWPTQAVAAAWCIAVDIVLSPRGLSTLQKFMKAFFEHISGPGSVCDAEQQQILVKFRDALRRNSPLLVIREFSQLYGYYESPSVTVPNWPDNKLDLRRHEIHVPEWLVVMIPSLYSNPDTTYKNTYIMFVGCLIVTLVHEIFHMFRAIIGLDRHGTPPHLSWLSPAVADPNPEPEAGGFGELGIFGGWTDLSLNMTNLRLTTWKLRTTREASRDIDLESAKRVIRGDIGKERDPGPLLTTIPGTEKPDYASPWADDPLDGVWGPEPPAERVAGVGLSEKYIDALMSIILV